MAKQLYEVLIRFNEGGAIGAHAEYRDWESGKCETLPLDSPDFPAPDRATVDKLLGSQQATTLSRAASAAIREQNYAERVRVLEEEVAAAKANLEELRVRAARAELVADSARAELAAAAADSARAMSPATARPVAETAPKSLLDTLTFGLLK